MRNYIGKYRVLVERDDDGDVTDLENTYLVSTVNNNYQVSRHGGSTLTLLIQGGIRNNIVEPILEKFRLSGVPVIEVVDCVIEGFIRFDEKYLDTVDGFLVFKRSGAKMKPESIKNHPRHKEMKEDKRLLRTPAEIERLRILGERLKSSRKPA